MTTNTTMNSMTFQPKRHRKRSHRQLHSNANRKNAARATKITSVTSKTAKMALMLAMITASTTTTTTTTSSTMTMTNSMILPGAQAAIDYSDYTASSHNSRRRRNLNEDRDKGNDKDNKNNNNDNHQRRHYRHYHSHSTSSGAAYPNSAYNRQRASSISDIFLCLVCALGWMVWFISMTQLPQDSYKEESLIFDREESKTVMGHVLQVSLGEDLDGTGIPVYHALIDYVIESNLADEEPLQVRKCFTTDKLLEEGFANVQVIVLVDDPTQSILLEDYLEDKHERFRQEPPGCLWYASVYLIVSILIGSSFIGAIHTIQHLAEEKQKIGWIILSIGGLLLYPVAVMLYACFNRGYYATLGPLWTRPGVIIHGAASRFECAKEGCGAMMLNPMELLDDSYNPPLSPRSRGTLKRSYSRGGGGGGCFGGLGRPSKNNKNTYTSVELPQLSERTLDTGTGDGPTSRRVPSSTTATTAPIKNSHNTGRGSTRMATAPKSPLYPNAGCGFGNFNIHMPHPSEGGESSVSSMSSILSGLSKSTPKNSDEVNKSNTANDMDASGALETTGTTTIGNGAAVAHNITTTSYRLSNPMARMDTSILEKYERGLDESLMLPR